VSILQPFKPAVSSDDSGGVPATSPTLWLAVALVAAGATTALLFTLASAVRNALYVHDLRVRVNELRLKKLRELQAVAERQIIEVDEAPASKSAA
jgi:hypothetical protein